MFLFLLVVTVYFPVKTSKLLSFLISLPLHIILRCKYCIFEFKCVDCVVSTQACIKIQEKREEVRGGRWKR